MFSIAISVENIQPILNQTQRASEKASTVLWEDWPDHCNHWRECQEFSVSKTDYRNFHFWSSLAL